MPFSLDFEVSYRYTSSAVGVELPVALSVGNQSVETLAKVDTGAAHSVFARRYAEMLGFEVESGRRQMFRTLNGVFSAYEHEVTLQSLGLEFTTLVFFAEHPSFDRNLLGRTGWLDRLRVAIIDFTLAIFPPAAPAARSWK
ncbi:MAG: retropepsin-like aspartic protease [Bryobacteraceae bacterium]|jgi:predicted aspartyl protease